MKGALFFHNINFKKIQFQPKPSSTPPIPRSIGYAKDHARALLFKSSIKGHKKYAMAQHFTNIIKELDKYYINVGRYYPDLDRNDAFFTLNQANQTKTAGTILSLPSLIEPKNTIYETLCHSHDISLRHPAYILSMMETAELAGEDPNSIVLLKQSAQNFLLGENRFLKYLAELNLKSEFVEKLFIEFALISKKAQQGLIQHLEKHQYSKNKFIESVEEYKRYINAIHFLVVIYCGKQNTEIEQL